ncbi:helix-turn-helix transcriptional regulator [Phytomonospora endophytica]|nr:helix-turn-helix transcriptional regulator [Phytomonospora endophytica]GIG64310.1 XRE family transcriptional regulator [Phytomonospora endophytica]
MDRGQLADFLRRRREGLAPADVGLPTGTRRRTPGLRREEVAALAGMSADYYGRLEQGRSPQPSTQLLTALARALRLGDDERDHLHLLAGHRPPAGAPTGDRVRPGLLFLLDRLADTPAQIVSDLGDVLAQNALARDLLGGVCTVSEHGRNVVWRWFTDPAAREAYAPGEHARQARLHVADLRAAVGRRGGKDAEAARLVARLLEASGEFARLWELHEVGVLRGNRMRVRHPAVGEIELDCEVLVSPEADQRLFVFTAPEGSPSVEALDRLRTVATVA